MYPLPNYPKEKISTAVETLNDYNLCKYDNIQLPEANEKSYMYIPSFIKVWND